MTEERVADRGSRTSGEIRQRLPAMVTSVLALLVLAGAIRVGLHGRDFVLSHPMNVLWIVGSLAAGIGVFSLNGARVGLRDVAPWLGYGILAAYFGFAVQGGVNGALAKQLGVTAGVLGFCLLGLGAAGAQTFAKWLVLRFLGRLGTLRSPSRAIRVGLAVGLGFGLTEIVILGQNQIVRHTEILVWPWIGIWERASAVGLHVFSGALLALGITGGHVVPVIVVLGAHTLVDSVAGAVSGGILVVPVVALEMFFSLVTGGVWLYYCSLRDAALAGSSAEGHG